jgi:hypothetical protein
MAGEQANRRAATRFAVQAPITIWDVGGRPEMSGVTRDVSSAGIFFVTESWPRRIRPFQFMLILPNCQGSVPGGIPVYCEGKVVRTDKRDSHEVGVAVRIERFRVRGLRPPTPFAV